MKNEPETVVVQVKHIVEDEETAGEAGAEAGPTQPEIVGRKVKETDEDEGPKERKREEIVSGSGGCRWTSSAVAVASDSSRQSRPTRRLVRGS